MPARRDFLALAATTTLSLAAGGSWAQASAAPSKTGPAYRKRFVQEMTRLEVGVAGRLGVAVLDTGNGSRLDYRADERFPMCSTFKLLATAAVLHRADLGQDDLARRIIYGHEDLQSYSPVTRDHVGGAGMSLAQLCEAAMTLSDNTAANLMLDTMGGPAGLTAYLRSLGDSLTRLDRNEPTLNASTPGDPRDTTTPAAMLADVQRLALGDALAAPSRALLVDWLVHNKTGDKRVRAGLPTGWKVGDKTGTGEHGSTNTTGVIWPAGEGRAPLLFAVYLTECGAPIARREAVHAAVGKTIAAMPG